MIQHLGVAVQRDRSLVGREAELGVRYRRKLGPKSRKLQNANYRIPICQSTNMSSTKRTKIKST
jgi:hypothetical protein